jgi:hypothetical protein
LCVCNHESQTLRTQRQQRDHYNSKQDEWNKERQELKAQVEQIQILQAQIREQEELVNLKQEDWAKERLGFQTQLQEKENEFSKVAI